MSRLAIASFAACVTLTAGCAENQETLVVLYSPGFEEDECAISTEEDAIAFGALDVAFETPYLMSAVLLNNAPSQSANDNNTGLMTNEIKLLRAEVVLDSPTDIFDDIPRNNYAFDAPLQTVSLAPQSEYRLAVEVVPTVTSRALRQRLDQLEAGIRIPIRANVVFVGSRSGNDVGKVGEVKSRDFSFPIEICAGCMVNCSGCEDGICTPEILEQGAIGNGCGNAQDVTLVPNACPLDE